MENQRWNPAERVTLLWMTVFGLDGSNGLRGSSKAMEKRLGELEGWREEVQTLLRLVRWLGLGIVSLSGFLASDKAAGVLRAILAALA